MRIIKYIVDLQQTWKTSFEPWRVNQFEILEPRLLFSGDSLLDVIPPDQFQDMSEVLLSAELLETNEQAGEDILSVTPGDSGIPIYPPSMQTQVISSVTANTSTVTNTTLSAWQPPIGIPAPSFGIDENVDMYIGQQYTFTDGRGTINYPISS
ncbi:MAG: LEPR-XLL domain-containing protein, partial [Sedimentisphaerales bacterium]|nr:LEPR-XLL domain-containing protein [Sedimentisphaerales bacterium]